MEWTEKMRKFNLPDKLLPLLIYNGISAVLVLVSLFVFNKAVLALDIIVYFASLTAMLALSIDFISTKFGALNILHMLLPCVLFYRSESFHQLDYSQVLLVATLVTMALLAAFWVRRKSEFSVSKGIVTLAFCVVVFCALYSSVILINAMFDKSARVLHECIILSIDNEYSRSGENSWVTVKAYAPHEENWDLTVAREYAETLSVGGVLTLESGKGAFGMEFFTVEKTQKGAAAIWN